MKCESKKCDKPKCQWICEDSPCLKKCDAECEPPKCRIHCATAEPPKCRTVCPKPVCRNVCKQTDCGYKCKIECQKFACGLECENTPPKCEPICDPPQCKMNCKNPESSESCPPPKCYLKCWMNKQIFMNHFWTTYRTQIAFIHMISKLNIRRDARFMKWMSTRQNMNRFERLRFQTNWTRILTLKFNTI